MMTNDGKESLQAALHGRGPCDVVSIDGGLIVRERAGVEDQGAFVAWDGRRSIGSTPDGTLIGFDHDGAAVVWRPGERAVAADDLGEWGGWHVHRDGFDTGWIDPRGRLHRADGSVAE